VTFDTAYGDLPVPLRTGYTFEGWAASTNGVVFGVDSSTVVAVASNHTLAANWTASDYTVTFDPAGGAVNPVNKPVTFGSVYGELPVPSLAGHAFAAWLCMTNGVAFGVWSNSVVSVASDHTLVSQWSTNTYTVTFDAQGGAVDPASKVVAYRTVYGTLPVPVLAGHTFSGWWTAAGSDGLQVIPASAVTNLADLTLFARYIQSPVVSARSPQADPAPVNEGASVSFSVTAGDGTDPDTVKRGMSNIVWFVDGVKVLEKTTGAPNAITSAYTLKTTTNTVQGAAYRDVIVTSAAFDMQGCRTDISWTVRVMNMPAAQTLSFPPVGTKVLGDEDFFPRTSASSGLPVMLASSNEAVAAVVDGWIHITGAGTAVITASQSGNFDFKAATPVKQTLIVKARLTAEVSDGGGAVTSAGLYLPGTKVALSAKPNTGYMFLHWEDGSQIAARSLIMPNANMTVSAWFGTTTNVAPPAVSDPGPQGAMVGVPFTLALDIASASLPSVTLLGLPPGLKYNAATKTISGVPTAPVTNKVVTVTAKNVSRFSGARTFTMTVDPLPGWAQGTFSGVAGNDALGSGSASMSVTAVGAASGKLTLRGTNFSFSAKNYSSRGGDGSFILVTTAVVGRVSWPLTFSVNVPEITDTTGTVPLTLSKAEGVLSSNGWTTLYRNIWKDAGMVTVLTNRFTGYYTAVLPGGSEYGSGYLAFTVDKAGGVKATGKLADGTPVSLAGTLILDEAGRVFAVLYTVPAAYKGGGLFGLAEFVKVPGHAKMIVRLLDGEPFVWESLNQMATGDYYAGGFSREPGLTGGWYDTLGNLYAYYMNGTLSVGTEGAPVPEVLVGTNRYDSVWWDPDGIALTVVTNSLGVMTGLSVPRASVPVKAGTNMYDYASAANAVVLTITLTRSTGLFKGSFKAWFDYAATPTSKTISYEGVLTPEREDKEDGVAGRGFFLWADKAQYTNSYNRLTPYSFRWSYDLKILLPAEMVRVQGGSLPDIGNGAITVDSF
jgi:uncharacterized repeat protein (TIGR02543 family)